MGNTAATLADRLIITNDNPRSELPAEIFKDILEGIPATVIADVVEDRAAAIAFAVQQAAVEDTILIAGKGHEPYQIIGAKRLPFLDYEVARAHLAARSARNAEVQ
jgi:UDP-N-acetylmuramoyl-L-alanyl-D-glutamate--2,6-diaminopimelate ligase